MQTRAFLAEHYRKYPKLQISDAFKYIFQSSFGCEHLVDSEKDAAERIKREYESVRSAQSVDRLDGEYSRVPLSFIGEGMAPETLARLFFLSAKKESDGAARLHEKLDVIREMTLAGELPFDRAELEEKIAAWSENGFCPLHHSEEFREAYKPSYRVIAERYVKYLPLFLNIDKLLTEKDSVILAIEGGSAAGKTTLSKLLCDVYDCNTLHMDDFFLRPEQRTPERFSEVGGNVDRERVIGELLLPLSENREVRYRPFDCSTMSLGESVTLTKKRLSVVEGVYSMHPELEGYYDLSVFLEISPELQMERIKKRNTPAMAERFFTEWIPLEARYFEATQPKKRCTLVF